MKKYKIVKKNTKKYKKVQKKAEKKGKNAEKKAKKKIAMVTPVPPRRFFKKRSFFYGEWIESP